MGIPQGHAPVGPVPAGATLSGGSFIRGLHTDYVPIPGMGISSLKAAPTQRVLEDGTLLLLGLAPGRYVVRVQGNEPAEPVTVEVQSGRTAQAKLVIGEAKPPAAP